LILLRRRVFSSTASATRRRTRASSLGSISIAPEDRRKISLGPGIDDAEGLVSAQRDRVAGLPVRYGRVQNGRVGWCAVLVLEPEVEACHLPAARSEVVDRLGIGTVARCDDDEDDRRNELDNAS
jgi:hypothetical protein